MISKPKRGETRDGFPGKARNVEITVQSSVNTADLKGNFCYFFSFFL